MKFLLLSDHLSPFFDGWSSDYISKTCAYLIMKKNSIEKMAKLMSHCIHILHEDG